MNRCERSNVKYYRDLSLPMGAQNSKRLNLYIDRFQNCMENNEHSMELYRELQEDPDEAEQADEILESIIPPYYYGSHYSTPLGCVLYYLVREEPYTSLHVLLQDNHFDVSDRLFHSVPVTSRSCIDTLPEIKEVTPEWFFSTEFLINRNHQRFGTKQDGEEVDDVKLPYLTNGIMTPELLISRHIQGLEGPVSTTFLSEWIDLIFGFKQQGDEAVKNYNLFYYMTYPDQVDISHISDIETRNGIITQSAHFGQCPAMLFYHPHPKRRPGVGSSRSLRNILLETDRHTIYKDGKTNWIGDRCRLHFISDHEGPSVSLTPWSLQRILGTSEYASNSSCFFDPNSIYCCRMDDSRDSTMPTIVCPDICLSWAPYSHYPWRFMIDCNDYTIVSCFKIVLDDIFPESSNRYRNCYSVEYFTSDNNWKVINNRIFDKNE